MNENESVSEEMIRKVEDESPEIIDEAIEPFEEGISNMTEGPVSDPVFPKKAKQHTKTLYLVKKTKKMLQEANDKVETCKRLMEKSIQEYEDAKSELKANGLDACAALVKKLGYETKNDLLEEKETVVFTPNKELNSIVLKEMSSGRFTGLVYGLLGGVATAIGSVYLATVKLNMRLDVTHIPSGDQIQSIMAWFSTLLGRHEDVTIGASVLGVLVVLVMLLIYVVSVRLKRRSMLHLAVKQFIEAELYLETKANCKDEADKIEIHIKDTLGMMRTYEVLLNEQKGKLERIYYVEGEREKSTDYHTNSYAEIHETKALIRAILEYMNTPIALEGELSEKSVFLLQQAKDQADTMLKRFY